MSKNKNEYTLQPIGSRRDGKMTKLSQSNYKLILVLIINY